MLYVVGWGLMVLANMPIAFTLGVTAFLFLWIDGGPLVSYAVIASASVGKLFIAGLVPGVLTAIFLMVYHYFYARRRGFKPSRRASLRELWAAFRHAFLALLTPVIIMGGIFGGIFTP